MNRITLFLMTLGLSLAPVLCWAAERKADEAKAIAEIEKLGGKVTRDEKSPGQPVVTIDLWGSKVTDNDLAKLNGLSQLQELNLSETSVTDVGLKRLKGLPNLQELDLSFTKVTDAGLEHLKALPRLEKIDLALSGLTDAGLKQLKLLKQLKSLMVNGTHVTDAGLEELKALPHLQTLGVSVARLSRASIKHFKALPQLQELRFDEGGFGGASGFDDEHLELLKELPQLKRLQICNPQTTANGLKQFKQAMPRCKVSFVAVPVS